MKYFLLNLGCQMNLADSQRIQAILNSMGLEQSQNEDEAQILGIVACSVRQKAIDRVYSKIHAWNERKNLENILTFVSGCVLPADREKFLQRFDLVFSTEQAPLLPQFLSQYGVVTPLSQIFFEEIEQSSVKPLTPSDRSNGLLRPQETSSAMASFWKVAPNYSNTFEAFIPIQNGCDKFCSFCAVPYTRGREVSRPSADILAEVIRLIDAGYRSITLLGQNVNSYGQDNPKEISFAKLLQEIGKLGEQSPHTFWTYFTSPHPRDMSIEVFETIAKYSVLAKQIHLPLQSGDDKVLIRMNRHHTRERYDALVADIRRILPQATLFTDIIVGFTGETDEQFENTRLAMVLHQFQMAFIALYSPRPGAASARWKDDVPHSVKKTRFQALNVELARSSMTYNQRLVGKTLTVLAEKLDRKSGFLVGRTEGKIVVRFCGSPQLIGQFVQIKLDKAFPLSLEGTLEQKDDKRNPSAFTCAISNGTLKD